MMIEAAIMEPGEICFSIASHAPAASTPVWTAIRANFDIATSAAVSSAEVALAVTAAFCWPLQRSRIVSPIPNPRTTSPLRKAAAAKVEASLERREKWSTPLIAVLHTMQF